MSTLSPHSCHIFHSVQTIKREDKLAFQSFVFRPENVSGARFYTFSVNPQEVLTNLQVHVLLWCFQNTVLRPFLDKNKTSS